MPVQLKPFKGKRKQSGMIYEGHFNSVTEEYDPAFSYTVETVSFKHNKQKLQLFTLCSVPISGKDWGQMWVFHWWKSSFRSGTESHWGSAMSLASLLRLTPWALSHSSTTALQIESSALLAVGRPCRKTTSGRSRTFGYCVLVQSVLHRHLLDQMPQGA